MDTAIERREHSVASYDPVVSRTTASALPTLRRRFFEQS